MEKIFWHPISLFFCVFYWIAEDIFEVADGKIKYIKYGKEYRKNKELYQERLIVMQNEAKRHSTKTR